jgi:hypothetical protein
MKHIATRNVLRPSADGVDKLEVYSLAARVLLAVIIVATFSMLAGWV